MNEILYTSICRMAGQTFECACGRKHSIGIGMLAVGKGVTGETVKAASAFRHGQIFMMADNNTYDVCGCRVEKLFNENGFNLKTFIFRTSRPLVPDERALGRLLTEIGKDTSVIVAVGAGTLNDLARFLSYKLGIPYIIVCTAPSMDGYASTVSPLIVEGFKKTFEAVYPYAVIADTDTLKEAPVNMIKAGFGDIVGKLTALCDWELSRRLNGEYWCGTSVGLVRNAVKKCAENAGGVENREEGAIYSITEALILSGIAMGLVGNSRPASGAEHHLAHFWEMDALARGEEHPLHGSLVGVGAVVVSSIYEMLKEDNVLEMDAVKPDDVRKLLGKAGACSNPAGLGIRRELFRQSVLHAKEIRPRYTVLQLASEKSLLERYADILTERFYG